MEVDTGVSESAPIDSSPNVIFENVESLSCVPVYTVTLPTLIDVYGVVLLEDEAWTFVVVLKIISSISGVSPSFRYFTATSFAASVFVLESNINVWPFNHSYEPLEPPLGDQEFGSSRE